MAARRILMLALAGAAATAVDPGVTARASPRSDPTAGRAVFTGATLPHATSIGLAPAALGLGQFDEIYVALTGLVDQLRIDLEKIALDGTRSAGPKVRNSELSPGAMFAFIYHLAGDQITLGFEARTNPRESFPSNREELRYHTLGDGQRDWLATVGASFKVTGGIFVGASLSHQNTRLRLRFARDTALENGHGDNGVDSDCGGAPCGIENPLATERWDVNVNARPLSTSNLRVNIGVVWQLARDMWIAAGYHTPPGLGVQTELGGNVDITRAPRDVAREGEGALTRLHGTSVVEIQFPASADAELRARLPHQLDLHVGGRWEDLSRFRGYDIRTYGTTLPRNGIPEWVERARGMHDAFAFWAGVEQVDAGGPSRFLFGGRLGFETSAVDAERTSPLTLSPPSYTLDLGAQRRITTGLVMQLSYGLQYFPTVDARNSAFDPRDRIACIESGFDYATPACAATRYGYAIPTAAGDYRRIDHAFRIGLRYEIP